MSTPAKRRVLRDYQTLQEDPPVGVSGGPTDYNLLVWDAIIFGPVDTPFEDGAFRLSIEFTEGYPHVPPIVRFTTDMFHPNIYKSGHICMDMLQENWSPIYDMCAVLVSIQSLLLDPNLESPANHEAAELYFHCRSEYNRRVKALADKSYL